MLRALRWDMRCEFSQLLWFLRSAGFDRDRGGGGRRAFGSGFRRDYDDREEGRGGDRYGDRYGDREDRYERREERGES